MHGCTDNRWKVALAAIAMFAPVPYAVGQQTKVVDAGAGQKQEIVYDAGGQIVETRTIDAQGKLSVRVNYEFKPGYYAAQETTTNYFADGKSVSMLSKTTYDENGNFTGQSIARYDPSGKETEGHRVAHDPQTGMYHCWKWDANAQKEKTNECPDTEESGGEPEALKPLTNEQALKQLNEARSAAQAQEKAARLEPKSPAGPVVEGHKAEIGIVLPAQISAGERISGSVTAEPARFEGIPGLTVLRISVPQETTDRLSLRDWAIQAPGESPQQADSPFTLSAPTAASEFKLTLQRAGDLAPAISQTVRVERASKSRMPTAFEAPAICAKNDVCTIAGQTSGDAGKTFAAFGTVPGRIAAQTSNALYIAVPNEALRGPQYLVISEQKKLLAFPVAVAELELQPDSWQVTAGHDVLMHVSLDGPADLPDAQWRAGSFPASNTQRARAIAPDFRLKKETREQHEEREKREKQTKHEEDTEGQIVLAIRNLTPELVSFRESKNGSFAFPLTPESFQAGPFQYNFVVHPSKDGTFAVRAALIPFLAGVTAQEFEIPEDSAQSSPSR